MVCMPIMREADAVRGCSPKNGEKRKRALSGASLAAAMANHPHVLFDDEGVGRSPRSVAAKARYSSRFCTSVINFNHKLLCNRAPAIDSLQIALGFAYEVAVLQDLQH